MKNNYKYEYGDRVRITEEAAELICSHEPDVSFNFYQEGTVKDRSTIGRNKMYEVKFDDGSTHSLPQSYLERVENGNEH